MKDIGKKLMDIARWYSMPADHFNTIKEAVELLDKPCCNLKKYPFMDEIMVESEDKVCKDCYYNDGEVHAECVICDKMTREEAISILSRPRTMKNAPSDILKAHEMAIEALEQTRWIPVSKQLPKENEYIEDVCKYYLIQDEYGDMHVAHLSNVGWIPMDSLKAIGNEIVAWQELPQPYKIEPQKSEE